MEPFHNALEILNDIIKTEVDSSVDAVPFHYSTFDFVTYYSVSDRTVKRLIMDLKALGCDIYSERSASGHYVWRCRNWAELIDLGIYIKWLQLERDKHQGLPLVAEVTKAAPEKVCVMNCGPRVGDTRSRAERQAACSDCEPVRVPNRAESKYHFDDKRFNKP